LIVYGRRVDVHVVASGWQAFIPGADGTRSPMADEVIPSSLAESEIEVYLADLCHEWPLPATAGCAGSIDRAVRAAPASAPATFPHRPTSSGGTP
jgi:hypothetical protein